MVNCYNVYQKFPFQGVKNIPKLVFLVCKYNIWQPFPAGKVAWSKRIEDEQNGGQEEAERGSRQAQAYLPTFFTSEDNLSQLEATRRAAR
jgi:hypothetical protein